MIDRSPHLMVSLIGDIDKEPFAQVKYGFFIRALEREFRVNVCDVKLRRLQRLFNGLVVFHPDFRIWKERFYQNLGAFKARSRIVSRCLEKQKENIDIVLQIGVLFNSTIQNPDMPLIVYTDYTSKLSRDRIEQGRSPFPEEYFRQWFVHEQNVFHKAVRIYTRGSQVFDSIVQDYGIPAEKVSVVGGGLNYAELPALSTKKNSNPMVLFIGKDFYRKGGDMVVEAFHRARRQLPDIRLTMVTSIPGSFTGDLTGVTVIKPTWDRDRISALYREADCFILPSRLETWGDVLLEAMAFGLPCIGVADEAMADIIIHEKTGLLAAPGDLNDLAKSLEYLLSDKEARQKYGRAARLRVESLYTWERVAARMIPGIREVSEMLSG